jgi:hypothetical protein
MNKLSPELEGVIKTVIKEAARQDLTGAQKADFVYNLVADLDNGIPFLNAIPDELEIMLEKEIVEKIKEEIEILKPRLKEIIEGCFQKIKHLFHKK